MNFAVIIFLGGKAQRLGGCDKASLHVGDQNCLDWVYSALSGDFNEVALSTAAGQSIGLRPDLARIEDMESQASKGGVALAILACLQWAQSRNLDYVITTPVDTPFLPADFTKRLTAVFETSEPSAPVAAHCTGGLHGLHALWPVSCLEALRALILDEGVYKIQRLHTALSSHQCEFARGAYDPFMNINTPEDLKTAKQVLPFL